MENNEIILLENDKEVKYKVILDLEDVDGKNFIVYTKDDTKEYITEVLVEKLSFVMSKKNPDKVLSLEDATLE